MVATQGSLERRVLDPDHAVHIVGELQVVELLRQRSLVQEPDAMGCLVVRSRLACNGRVL